MGAYHESVFKYWRLKLFYTPRGTHWKAPPEGIHCSCRWHGLGKQGSAPPSIPPPIGSTQIFPHPVEQHFSDAGQPASAIQVYTQGPCLLVSLGQVPGLSNGWQIAPVPGLSTQVLPCMHSKSAQVSGVWSATKYQTFYTLKINTFKFLKIKIALNNSETSENCFLFAKWTHGSQFFLKLESLFRRFQTIIEVLHDLRNIVIQHLSFRNFG